MDSTLPPSLPTQPQRHTHRWLTLIIVLVLIGAGIWLWKSGILSPSNPAGTTSEEQSAQQAFEESKALQRLANLEGIHLLITKYKSEHGSYPAQLSDLTDIKGYAPGVAKMISETKLDNGQPAYTYTRADSSYNLCANKVNAEPTCEGPKK